MYPWNSLFLTLLTPKDLIIARLSNVRRWLDTVLRRLKPDLLEWSPVPGMRTIAGQLVEIIAVEASLVPYLKTGYHLTEAEVDAIVGDIQKLDNLLHVLTEVWQGTLNYINSVTNEELVQIVSSGNAWFGTLWFPAMPRSEHFLNIAEHEYYHVGQLISYL
jgi:hypothetical protein